MILLRFRFLLFICSWFITSLFLPINVFSATAPNLGQNNPFADFNEDQMVEFQKTLEAEIEKELARMSPKEREEFDEMVQKISQLNEQELEEFVTQMFEEEAKAKPEAEKQPETEAIATPEPTPEKPIVHKANEKQEKALILLDNLIRKINVFNQKTATTSELPSKIRRWKVGKKINWTETITWDSLKTDINALLQKLYKLRDSNAITHEYKYIDAFIANEPLYNALAKLLELLNQQDPHIKIPEFEAEKMNKATNKALRKALHGFYEAIHIAHASTELDKVFQTYEPTEKKLKAEEEQIAKKAREETAKERKVSPARNAGKAAQEPFYAPTQPSYDYGYRAPHYTPPSYPSSAPSAPSVEPAKSESVKLGGTVTKPGGFAGKAGSGASEKGGEEKAGKEKTEGGKEAGASAAEAAKKAEAAAKEKAAYKAEDKDKEAEDKRITKNILVIGTELEAVADLLKKNDTIKNLRVYLTSDKPVDADLENNIIPIIQSLTIIVGRIQAIQSKTKSFAPARRAHFQSKLKEAFDDNSKIFESLNEQLKIVKNDWHTIGGAIDQAKKAAYLGEDYVSPLEADLDQLAQGILKNDSATIESACKSALEKYENESFKEQLDNLKEAAAKQDQKAVAQHAEEIKQSIDNYKKKNPKLPKVRIAKPSLYDIQAGIGGVAKTIQGFAS